MRKDCLSRSLIRLKKYINSYYNITSFSFDSEKQVTVGISFRQESVYRYSSLNDYNGYYNSYMFVLKNVNGSWKIDFMRSNDNFYSYGGEISEIYCYNRAASADRLRFDGREVF